MDFMWGTFENVMKGSTSKRFNECFYFNDKKYTVIIIIELL